MLQELCQKCSKSPTYEIVLTEGKSHNPQFTFVCKVDDIQGEGLGRTKKLAKHEAAQAVYDILKTKVSPSLLKSKVIAVQKAPMTKKVKEVKLNESNPIGSLQELSLSRGWGTPTYKIVSDKGPPHNKEYIVLCTVGNFEQSGLASTKRTAKKLAATNLFSLLQTVSTNSRQTGDLWQNSLSTGIKKIDINNDLPTPMDRLRELAEEIGFKVRYLNTDRKTSMGMYQCLVHLAMSPHTVVHGTGYTEREAKIDGARNAINYIKVFE